MHYCERLLIATHVPLQGNRLCLRRFFKARTLHVVCARRMVPRGTVHEVLTDTSGPHDYSR
jgi:hypothetical protein